jgi:hypothetical protein
MPTLICKRVTFYSLNDELNFFQWLEQISCIDEINGRVDQIELKIPRRAISDTNLRDLLAIFYRYKIDMRQLKQFSMPRNQHWFEDEKTYWARMVFGSNGAS